MNIYASRPSVWKAGENYESSPKLEFVNPLFKRRLSQITKITIQVLHDLIERFPDCRNCKVVFASTHGEISRQLKINQMLIEDKSVMPAAFSLSVFNTPVAAASIVLGLKNGYSVEFASKGNFKDTLISASAPVLSGDEDKIIFAYADEKIPDEYGVQGKEPFAFATVISSAENENAKKINIENDFQLPENFLAGIL